MRKKDLRNNHMGKKATISPYTKCPLKKTQLILSRILTKASKKSQTHTCSSSHGLRVSTQTSESSQRCRCSCEKGITPLGAAKDWIHHFVQRKTTDGEQHSQLTPWPVFVTMSIRLTRAPNSKTAIPSCLRFTQKKVSSQWKKYLNLSKTLAFTSSTAKYNTTSGLAWYLLEMFRMDLRKAHWGINTHNPWQQLYPAGSLSWNSSQHSQWDIFSPIHSLLLKPSSTIPKMYGCNIFKEKSLNMLPLQQTEQAVTKVGWSWIWERCSAGIGK